MDISFLFENIVVEVDWTKFAIYFALVMANLLYAVFTFYYKKSNNVQFKVISWVLALSLAFFFMYVAVTNRHVLDYATYEDYYVSEYNPGSDALYYAIGVWMHKQNIPFTVYRGILYGFSYANLLIFLSVFKVNKNFVLSIYAYFIWFSCAILTRNWVGFSIILLALCLLKIKGKWKYIIGLPAFVVLVFIAYKFHSSCGFFAVFILCFFEFKGKNYVLRATFIVSIVLLMSLLFDNTLLKQLTSNVPFLYNALWVNEDRTKAVPIYEQWQLTLLVSLYYVLSAGVIYLSHSCATCIYPELEFDYTAGFKKISKEEKDDFHSINMMVSACVCMFILLPFFSSNFNFYRLIRFGSLFLLMGFSLAIQRSKQKFTSPFFSAAFLLYLFGTISLMTYLNVWEVGGDDGSWNYFFWMLFR